MNIKLICVGKIKEPYYTDMIGSFEKQIKKFCRFELIELPDEKIPKNAYDSVKKQILDAEGRRITANIKTGEYVIPLCIEGKQIDTRELGRLFSHAEEMGKQTITFIIGGSLGLSGQVTDRADFKLSFSAMTFPHQLMRVMLAEQICTVLSTIYGK